MGDSGNPTLRLDFLLLIDSVLYPHPHRAPVDSFDRIIIQMALVKTKWVTKQNKSHKLGEELTDKRGGIGSIVSKHCILV